MRRLVHRTWASMVRAALALLAAAAPAYAQSGVEGVWSGAVVQNEGTSGYEVVLTISPTTATTDYPSLNCSGRLERAGSVGGYIFFSETITRGRVDQGGSCIDGTVTIAPNRGRLAWGWFGTYGGKVLYAFADLTRK